MPRASPKASADGGGQPPPSGLSHPELPHGRHVRTHSGNAWQSVVALLVYAAGAVLVFGRGVVGAPATMVVGDAGSDKAIPMWSFVWWPHALARGHDPFDADVVWVPHGIDLAWSTTTPGVSLAATPLTALAGPVVTYNVVVLGGCALSGWAAFVLARHLCGSFWPSLAAGWIYGFSAYETGHMIGHLNLVVVPLVPLCALLVVRRQEGSLGRWWFIALLALALAGQFLISIELFFTLVLFGAMFLLLAFWQLAAEGRCRLRRTIGESLVALLLAAVSMSWYLVHAFLLSGPENAPARSPFREAADLLNYVVPTRRIWAGGDALTGVTDSFTAGGAERGAYLSVPLIAAAAAFALTRPGSPIRTILALGLVALVIASLGPEIRIGGHGIVPGPWRLLARLPVTKTALPARITLYVALVASLMVALWLTEGSGGRRWLRWATTMLGIALILPNPSSGMWASRVPDSAFFSAGAYKQHVARDETVLVIPFGAAGWSLLWQARTDMAFRLVGGHLGRRVTPAEAQWRPVYDALGPGPVPPGFAPLFRSFIVAHGVRTIVVAPGAKWRQRRIVELLGIRPVHTADVLVYRL